VILAHKIQLRLTAKQIEYLACACGTSRFVWNWNIYGTEVVIASKFYPSSKTCSNCGYVKAKLSLTERTFTCSECGFSLDRDLNAARNLSRFGLSQSNACGHHELLTRKPATLVAGGADSNAAKVIRSRALVKKPIVASALSLSA